MPEKNPTPEEVAAAVTELDSLLTFATPKSCAPDLLAIGVLTLPMLVRSKDQRKFHRAVHMVQPPVIAGRVCMRYIVTDAEMSALAGPEKEYRDKSRKPGLTPKEAVAIDNATHGDILVVPAVPRGQLRKLLSNATHGPLGAGCVLKIMSWFQVATTMLPTTPFIAYGDDDTFWAITRWVGTLTALSVVEPETRYVYAGAMQYHDYWDLRTMTSHGWFWTLPQAGRGYLTDFKEETSNPLEADEAAKQRAAPFQRPYPMAHGLGVVVSRALAADLPHAKAVSDFLKFYEEFLLTKMGREQAARIKTSPKCRLGTDSTTGNWIAALQKPVVAVDILNFNQNWPWPLPNRCHGPQASKELANLHTFHLYGHKASDATYWIHLHNYTTKLHTSGPNENWPNPRLRCRHAPDSSTARALMDRLLSGQVVAEVKPLRPGQLRVGWLNKHAREFPRVPGEDPWRNRTRLDLPDWLYCGVMCLAKCSDLDPGAEGGGKECGQVCQLEWPDLRRRRRR